MKHNYSCAIVDDEPKAIELLKECLAYLFPGLEILGSYTTWNEALPALRTMECDILFLDISMPGKSGMDLLALLPGIESEIIFITAHSEHALNAFKFSPAGYILKPIDDAQLTNSVDRALERVQFRKQAKQNSAAPAVSAKIGIPNNKGTDYLNIEDIIYLESVNNCTKVVATHGDITSSYTLSRFKVILEKHTFYQVHRSYIVNLNHIKRYTNEGGILMSNGLDIPISRNFKDGFLHMFSKVSKSQL
jgi:two-component system LytT family response regulator